MQVGVHTRGHDGTDVPAGSGRTEEVPDPEEEHPDVLVGVSSVRESVGKDPSWRESQRSPEADSELGSPADANEKQRSEDR